MLTLVPDFLNRVDYITDSQKTLNNGFKDYRLTQNIKHKKILKHLKQDLLIALRSCAQ